MLKFKNYLKKGGFPLYKVLIGVELCYRFASRKTKKVLGDDKYFQKGDKTFF